MENSKRYAVTLIGTGYRLVEPEQVFFKKSEAVAYAQGGLTRLGVFEARVQRQGFHTSEVQLFESDPLAWWEDEAQVARFRRPATQAEMDEAIRDAREREVA